MNDNGIHIFIKKNIPNSFFRSTENYVESWTVGGTKKKGVTRNVGAPLSVQIQNASTKEGKDSFVYTNSI